jgi:hypothetical protein
MPKALQYLSVSYRALLWLYPSDLRDAYGQDMANIFEQQLWTEWTKRGTRGVAAAGCRAFCELFTVAIPRRLMSDRVIAAGLSLVITSGVLALLVGIMMWPRYRFR